MKKNSLTYSVVILAFVFSACEKVIEPKSLPEQDPRIVMNCILYNDSNVTANISSSKSILSGKDYKYLDNATCVLYEDNQPIEQLVNYKNGNYKGQTIPKINKTYTLKVSASGFNEVEGSSRMESPATVARVERYDTLQSRFTNYGGISQYIGGSIKLKLWINDDLSTQNYYSVQPIINLYDSNKNLVQGLSVFSYLSSTTSSENSGIYSNGTMLDTDDLVRVNGNQILLDLEVRLNYSGSGAFVDIASVEMYFQVSSISQDLYKYKVTLNQQLGTGVSLFAEPVLVHNNIKNGMGIIGSMNSDTVFAYKGPIFKQ